MTKTTNNAMMILDVYYYYTRCVGPQAAEAYLTLLLLNPLANHQYFKQYAKLHFNACSKLLLFVV